MEACKSYPPLNEWDRKRGGFKRGHIVIERRLLRDSLSGMANRAVFALPAAVREIIGIRLYTCAKSTANLFAEFACDAHEGFEGALKPPS